MNLPTRRSEAGFALPLAIFFMAILTLMLSAAFAKVQGDRRVADSSGAAVTALAIAQSGLAGYVGAQSSRPADGDSVRLNVSGGYADVIAVFAQRFDTLNPMYVVRSTGHVIVPTEGADPQASRTVAQFVQWRNTGALSTYPAVFTALNGINDYVTGTVNIFPNDSASCGMPAIQQLTVPNNNPRQSKAPPGVTVDGHGNGTLPGLVGVDWATITGGGFTPDYTTMTNLNTWSTYLINGDATLSTSGSGLLMVTGNLTISTASVRWAGVVLVGKSIIVWTGATPFTIAGLTMTGLNAITGATPPSGTLGGTGLTQNFRYNSCDIRRAMQFETGFNPVSNAWVDNWGTY